MASLYGELTSILLVSFLSHTLCVVGVDAGNAVTPSTGPPLSHHWESCRPFGCVSVCITVKGQKRKTGSNLTWHLIRQVAAPCNVAHAFGMTWHWIHQVAAPCNVARGCGMTWHWIHQVAASCNVAYAWLRYDITFNSPHGSTLQCVTWLCDYNNGRWRRK